MYIQEAKDLKKITEEIHDMWFDINQIRESYRNGVALIKLAKQAKDLEKSKSEQVIKISRVNKLDIKDTEKVGYYDFNEIKYDKDKGFLEITTGVPVSIKLYVESIEIVMGNNS